jgi:hypothetical protein
VGPAAVSRFQAMIGSVGVGADTDEETDRPESTGEEPSEPCDRVRTGEDIELSLICPLILSFVFSLWLRRLTVLVHDTTSPMR